MNYYQALKKRKAVTLIPEGMTRDRVIAGIEGATKALIGPMSNAERIMTVHDRDDLRDILRLMDAK